MKVKFITIGEIVAPHGYRGAVRVLPLTDFPDRFRGMTRIIVCQKGERKSYAVEKVGGDRRFIILKLAGIETIEAAAALRGALLEVPREEVVSLPPGHFYIFDIIGLKVWSEEGDFLGEVSAVLKTGANDVYSVRTPTGQEILIPALKAVVREIDLPGERMVVRLPEGLV
uniref:Ribosome maturation factor RimM n=1 Tax=Ammonifex degensii TaxID=42838 RepID=A0A7C1FE02_9THEO